MQQLDNPRISVGNNNHIKHLHDRAHISNHPTGIIVYLII